ncbi:MAG: hypothetical protein ACYTGE_18830 [Planctomycetota bacterium]|jgi:hypothetical protein
MNDAARQESAIRVLSPAEAQRAVEQARCLYQRILSIWVCDLLALRRAGLDTPGWIATAPDSRGSVAA